MENKLKSGDKAPEFKALDENGESVALADFQGRKVILYFYPKDNTSGCTAQACGFRDSYPAIEERNAVVIGVSPDSAQSHRKFRSKYELPFTLVVDPEHKLAELYGAWGEKSMYGKKYMGIIRSHFVIDEQGYLIDVHYKVSPGDSVSGALAVL